LPGEKICHIDFRELQLKPDYRTIKPGNGRNRQLIMSRANGKEKIRAFLGMLKEAFRVLSKNDPLRMAGATAFFTSFALPPILIILIQVLGLVFNKRKISIKLFRGLEGTLESESINQVADTLKAFRNLASNWFITIAGFLFLLFVATTLFKVVKDSINQLWKIQVINKRSLGRTLLGRLESFLLIVLVAVLFVPVILLTGAQAFLGKQLNDISPELAVYFNGGLNALISVVVVTLWFSILLRYLPDARPAWKVVLGGAFLTSLLFNSGRFVLHWLLTQGSIGVLYGSSGSIVVLLLFMFYSSFILYYGVCFTRIYAVWLNMPIKPLNYAISYRISEIQDEEELKEPV
jgi:membrane protein